MLEILGYYLQTHVTLMLFDTVRSPRSATHMIGICLSSPVMYNFFFWMTILNDSAWNNTTCQLKLSRSSSKLSKLT